MSVAIIYDDIKAIYKKKIGENVHVYLKIKSVIIYENVFLHYFLHYFITLRKL